MPFWSVNPYIGCEFGCSYCYARDTHRYTLERAIAAGVAPASLQQLPAAESFERNILIKDNAAELLTKALASAALGSGCLDIEIITKSPLVTRDIDVLLELSRIHDLRVLVSLATVHTRLARRLEARTAVPAVRLRALAALRQAGACFAGGSPLRLGPAARRSFLPHASREFPGLAARYRAAYGRSNHAPGAYRAALERRLDSLKQQFGFDHSSERHRPDSAPADDAEASSQVQLPLL